MHPLSRYPPKPHFQSSALYVKNLPETIEEDKIRRIFNDFQIMHINIINAVDDTSGGAWRRRVWGEMEGTRVAQIEFRSIAIAEKAFALLNFRIVSDLNPPLVLAISSSRDQSPFISNFSGYPRLVRPLPSHFTDIDLYTLIRRFGALASARMDDTLGGIVQFWTEDDAQSAEVAVRVAFAQTSKITLQAYNPHCIICANLSLNIDELRLGTLFQRFAFVTDAKVMRNDNGTSTGLGLVSFRSPDDASTAIHTLHGTLLESKELVLRYHEPGMSLEFATRAARNSNAIHSKVPSNGNQTSPDGTKKPSGPPAASSKEAENARRNAELQESERKKNELREQEKLKKIEEKARKEREEIQRKARDEAKQKELEEVKRKEEAEREAAKRKDLEEAGRKKRDAEQKAREEAEAAKRKELDEVKRKLSEEVKRKEREEVEREAVKQKALAEAQQQKRDAEQKAREEAKAANCKEHGDSVPKTPKAQQKENGEIEQEASEAGQKDLEEAEPKNRDTEQEAHKSAEAVKDERRESEKAEQKLHDEAKQAEEEVQRKEKEEVERKAHELAQQKEQEEARLKEKKRFEDWKDATQAEQKRCRMRDNEMQNKHPWSNSFALQRVKSVGGEFKKFEFSEENPLVFENIPWPVLQNPATLRPGDITSARVRAFFDTVKKIQKPEVNHKVLEVVNQLFLPDNWRARGILETVMDPELRDSLEKAMNVVSKVLTQLWETASAKGSV